MMIDKLNVVQRFMVWTTLPRSHPFNFGIAIVSLVLSGVYIHAGFSYLYLDMLWRTSIEWMMGAILVLVGIWQLQIFSNKYVAHETMKYMQGDNYDEFKN